MLVLSRKESQRIRLGDAIVVTIVKISGDKVRIGIEAPTDVLVLRDELEARVRVPAETVTGAAELPVSLEVEAAPATLRQSA